MDTLKYRQRVFLLICAIYLVLAFAYAILVPPWESPDEPAHYLYAMQVAERARPPLKPTVQQKDYFCRDYAFISSNHQWYQPALGYLPAAVIYKTLDTLAPSSLPHQIPPLDPRFCPNPFVYHNLFMHANPQLIGIWKDGWGVLVIRMVLSLLGLVVVYTAYRLGSVCDKANSWLGIIVAGWIAFLPQFTFVNANVRSDTLTNAIAALVFLLAVRMQISDNTHTNMVALGMGILLGLGLVSKYTFIYIIPIGLLAVVLKSPHSPRVWFKPLILVILPMVIIAAGYHLAFNEARIALIYTFTTLLRIKPEALRWDYIREIFQPLFIDIFFARFGWANVIVPATWSHMAFGIWLTGVVTTLVHTWYQRKYLDTTTLKIITLSSAGILLAIAGVIRFNLADFQPQGRYLFPAIVPWTLLGFWGWWQVLSPRAQKITTIAIIGFMLAFNLYALLFVLIPAHYK